MYNKYISIIRSIGLQSNNSSSTRQYPVSYLGIACGLLLAITGAVACHNIKHVMAAVIVLKTPVKNSSSHSIVVAVLKRKRK